MIMPRIIYFMSWAKILFANETKEYSRVMGKWRFHFTASDEVHRRALQNQRATIQRKKLVMRKNFLTGPRNQN